MNAEQSTKVICTVLFAALIMGENPVLTSAPTLMGIFLIVGTAIYVAVETRNEDQ